MVQAADLVNIIVKNTVGYYDDAGVALQGDGVTADDVLLATALTIAAAGGLEPTKDVKVRSQDFATIAGQLSRGNDGSIDPKVIR